MKKSILILFYISTFSLLFSCKKGPSPIPEPIAGSQPIIHGFSPEMAFSDEEITIYGSKFDAEQTKNTVKINGVVAKITKVSSGEITAIVPAGSTSGKVTLTTTAGSANSEFDFTVIPAVYKTIRLKTIFDDQNNSSDFFYAQDGKLSQIKSYEEDLTTGNRILNNIVDYTYTIDSKLQRKTSISASDLNYSLLADYSYNQQTGAFLGYTFSEESKNPINSYINLISSYTYSFNNGYISKLIGKNAKDVLTSENTYSYALVDGLFTSTIIYNNGGQTSTNKTTFFKGIPDPWALYVPGDIVQSNLLIKEFVHPTAKFSYKQTAEVDGEGKLISVLQSINSENIKTKYIYEPKP